MARSARSWWLAPLAAALAAVATLTFDQETGFPALLELRRELALTAEDLLELRATRDQLTSEIEGLRDDPFRIEARARASLGMVRPGERVLRFAPDPDPAD